MSSSESLEVLFELAILSEIDKETALGIASGSSRAVALTRDDETLSEPYHKTRNVVFECKI